MTKYACYDCDATFDAPTDTETCRCPGCGEMAEQQPAVVSPPTDRAASGVREQLLDALDFSYCQGLGYATPEALLAAYDASRAVLPEPIDRAAALQEAADHFDRMGRTVLAASQVRDELRRLAVEAHDTGTQQQDAAPTSFVLWLDASDGSVPTHDGIQWPDGTTTIHHRHFGITTTHHDPEAARRAAHGEQGRIVWPHTVDEPAPVAQQPSAEAPGPWVVQKICCGRDDGQPEFATWEAADRFRETYIDSSRVAGHERSAIVRRKDAPATEQQAAAADGEEMHRCAHTDIVYGRCVLPIPHDGECVHEHQPRCAMPSPDGQHSCVLPPNHEWLHADKHLAEVMPNGNRVVWETPIAEPPSA